MINFQNFLAIDYYLELVIWYLVLWKHTLKLVFCQYYGFNTTFILFSHNNSVKYHP
jgi:hypothetical protein